MESAELLELPEDEPHHLLDLIVGVEGDLPGGSSEVPDRHSERKLATARLAQLALVQPLLQDVQFRFAHGSFEAKEQPVVDTVEIRDKRRKQRADLKQLVPILRGARKPGHLHAQDEPHMVEAYLRNQPRESLPALGAAGGLAQVFIDDQDAPRGPAQDEGMVHQPILEVGGLPMIDHLLDCRLPDVDHRQPLQVVLADLLGVRR
jgi:hypothetical protein